ncbi:hypothetical protein [Leucobacter sp. USHLN153]|uniref:hypothetical protein n=1 Tax=Leucobacter sp. USHLN153 TaxID=3081268 RepID=UPI0030179BCA
MRNLRLECRLAGAKLFDGGAGALARGPLFDDALLDDVALLRGTAQLVLCEHQFFL